ncbi:MAG TPA: hypothetical protein VM577_03450 [Anaerovoracaceae bacterium]|nr:hypothetical protein [Anaerovoracaceae bacterium]
MGNYYQDMSRKKMASMHRKSVRWNPNDLESLVYAYVKLGVLKFSFYDRELKKEVTAIDPTKPFYMRASFWTGRYIESGEMEFMHNYQAAAYIFQKIINDHRSFSNVANRVVETLVRKLQVKDIEEFYSIVQCFKSNNIFDVNESFDLKCLVDTLDGLQDSITVQNGRRSYNSFKRGVDKYIGKLISLYTRLLDSYQHDDLDFLDSGASMRELLDSAYDDFATVVKSASNTTRKNPFFIEPYCLDFIAVVRSQMIECIVSEDTCYPSMITSEDIGNYILNDDCSTKFADRSGHGSQHDKAALLSAIHQNWCAIAYASPGYLSDLQFCLQALDFNKDIPSFCFPNEIRSNDEFIIKYFSEARGKDQIHFIDFKYFSILFDNEEFVLRNINLTSSIHIYQHLSDRLKEKSDIVRNCSVDCIQFMPEHIVKDRSLMHSILGSCAQIEDVIMKCPVELRSEIEFLVSILGPGSAVAEDNAETYMHFPVKLFDKKIVELFEKSGFYFGEKGKATPHACMQSLVPNSMSVCKLRFSENPNFYELIKYCTATNIKMNINMTDRNDPINKTFLKKNFWICGVSSLISCFETYWTQRVVRIVPSELEQCYVTMRHDVLQQELSVKPLYKPIKRHKI